MSSKSHRLARLVLVMGFVTHVAACGRDSGSSEPLGVERYEELLPVVLASGGFASCKTTFSKPTGSAMFARVKKLLRGLEDRWGREIPYVASCFGLSSTSVRIATHEAPDDAVKGEVEDIYRTLDRVIASENRPVALHLVGHSYGGWVVLNRLAQRKDAYVRHVATIDPISRVRCTPGTFLKSYFGIGTDSGLEEACMESPRDLMPSFPAIQELAARWDNFYQDEFSALRATPIDQAVNHYVEYDYSAPFDYRAHELMDRDRRVFDVIAAEWL
jgi:pimeloyl-ACP methyl ester carboxylesterase